MWILILMFHAGVWAKGNDVGTTNIPGFATQQACVMAGAEAAKLGTGTMQGVKYVCVHQ
jgi:hypothetical protein